jgi:hypothetical protein
MNRAELGYAVLLSLPVGAGVSVGFIKATGQGPADPLVIGAGAVAALAVFTLAIAGVAVGSPNIDD